MTEQLNRSASHPSSSNQPSGNQPSGNQPSDNQSSGNQPSDNQPSDNQPSNDQSMDNRRIGDPLSATTRTTPSPKNPVVLVHGIWNTAGIFSALKSHLEQAGWQVYALSMSPNNGDAPLESLAEQVKNFVNDCLGPYQPFDMVGFSMGGLVSRYYAQRLGGLARLHRFVTLSAPHQGTVLGAFSHRYGVRQMKPGSDFLRSLNKDAHQLASVQFFSFWTPFDLLILPPWSSQLGIGITQRLQVSAHNQMIRDRKALQAIENALSTPAPLPQKSL
ncbi:MAG: alpha/beta fold hydrolase [Cyanobacteria bacterium J06649_5]